MLPGAAVPTGAPDSGRDVVAVVEGGLSAIDGPVDTCALVGGASVLAGDPHATTSRPIDARRRVALAMAISSSRARSPVIVHQTLRARPTRRGYSSTMTTSRTRGPWTPST